jgi:tol-pal system protein YbgF
MVALQGDIYRVAKSHKATREAVKDLSSRFGALETRMDGLESSIEGLTVTSEEAKKGAEEIEVASDRYDALEARVKQIESALGARTSQERSPSHEDAGEVSGAETGEVQPERRHEPAADKVKEGRQDHSAKLAYENAYDAYRARRYDEALRLFEDFLKRYPDHELADNAQYWLGETYYDMGDYGRAILTFKDVVTRYASHAKAPDALLKIGYAYLALDDPSNARMFLKRVTKNYPASAAEAKARAKLKEIDTQSQ